MRSHSRNGRALRLAIHFAVICAFLAAEALAFGHPLDVDAHSSDEPCKICLSLAGLGGAAVAKLERYIPVGTAASAARRDRVFFDFFTPEGPPARGPPR